MLMIISEATQTPTQTMHSSSSRVFPIIKEIASANGIRFSSCLDIGCANRPCKRWFEKFEYSVAPKIFIGTETDPDLVERGVADGIDIVNPFETTRDVASDLVLALEVLEHITVEDSPEFFSYCKKNTKKLFALTTPNFEYFKAKRPIDAALRWIPDHLAQFNPASSNPHVHKQAVTPQTLTAYFADCFEADQWHWRIYRAWPWEIKDLSNERSFSVYFKLFGVAWKPA